MSDASPTPTEQKAEAPPPRSEGGAAPPRAGGESFFSSVYPRVFVPAAVLIVAFVIWGAADSEGLGEVTNWIFGNVVSSIGWYYVAIVTLFLIFSLVVGISRMGDIRLGKPGEKPEFSNKAWVAMLFSAGMGIGLVFWGVAEPLTHFAAPWPGRGESDAEHAEAAMTTTLLHWGLHAWGIYVVVGLAMAYAIFRKGRPVSFRWALEPLFGDRVKGWIGDVIDIVAVLGTVFGVATSLGLGASQIAGGFGFLGWVEEPGDALLVGIIAVITFIAVFSVVSGLKRGIKWLSQFNVSVAGLLALFVLIVGPTLFIFREFVESISRYVQSIVGLSMDVGNLHGEAGEAFMVGWTVFYWGWWISWAPFVGMFIARISRGRTVREFVLGVLFIPTVVTIAWFAIMGGSAIEREIDGDGGIIVDGAVDNTTSLFALLDGFPLSTFVSIVAILLITTFFVTSSDSGSLVVDMVASGGDPNPPAWSRVFWATTEGAVAAVLLLAGGGGLAALQTGAITLAFPFSIVMVLMVIATWKVLREEHLRMRAADEARRHELMAAQVTERFSESVAEAVAEEGPPSYLETPAHEREWSNWWQRLLDRLKSRPGGLPGG
ncbi:MAG TPA: BCCT family transporter [Jiangellaceae bacterium]|nr:BCCT family transporter [Jiangellaceae bacterium]